MFQKVMGVLAFMFVMFAFASYVWAMLRNGAKPQKSSWIIWTVNDTVIFAGMLSAGTANGQMWGTVIGAWAVVSFALKFGVKGWTTIDKLCLSGAALGITLFLLLDDPILAIGTSLAVVFFGSVPTFMGAWKEPENENQFAWVLFGLSCVASVLGIPAWTIADAAQPLTFLAVSAVMAFILFVRPYFIVRKAVRDYHSGRSRR